MMVSSMSSVLSTSLHQIREVIFPINAQEFIIKAHIEVFKCINFKLYVTLVTV